MNAPEILARLRENEVALRARGTRRRAEGPQRGETQGHLHFETRVQITSTPHPLAVRLYIAGIWETPTYTSIPSTSLGSRLLRLNRAVSETIIPSRYTSR